MSKWIAEFELEDGDTMPEHMDLNYMGAKIDFHCKPLEPTTKNDLVVDAVSREKAIMWAEFYTEIYDAEVANKEIMKMLRDLSSVTPIRAKGHWIENAPEYQNIDPPYICSECGNMHLRKTNYCDQCGADMRASED